MSCGVVRAAAADADAVTVGSEAQTNTNAFNFRILGALYDFVYDDNNGVTCKTDSNGKSLAYTYDAAGNQTSIVYPGGLMVSYTYDAAHKMLTATDWGGRRTSYSYDAAGRLLNTTRPDGSVLTETYDKDGRRTSLIDKNCAGIEIIGYTYGEAASSTNLTENPGAMTYDANNRLLSYGGQSVTYDAAGNILCAPLGGTVTSFTYDAGNRLLTAAGTSYTYDDDNNRLSQTVGGVTTNYVYDTTGDLSRMLMSTDASGSKTYYLYGVGLLGSLDQSGTYSVYHYDDRGSTAAITNAAGVVTDTFTYSIYGKLQSHIGTSTTPFLYNGRDGVMTDSNGLEYMCARYYSPELMRFINADTNEGASDGTVAVNNYSDANGNPISRIDPFGRYAACWGNKLGNGTQATRHLVTKQNLIALGWNTEEIYLNDGMVHELNSMLAKYNISEPEQIYHFLSQVMKESDDWYKSGLGDGIAEIGNGKYFIKYQGLMGNTRAGDCALFRGAGYLHLTGRTNYTHFYQHLLAEGIDDPLILSEGYSRMIGVYAWQSAAWFWSTATNLNEISLVQGRIVSRTVNDNGNMVTVSGNSTVFTVTKRVNGGLNGISDRMKYYNLVKRILNY